MEYQIKFRGIDRWNRPVFKVIDKPMYFGSTDTLFNDEVGKPISGKVVVNHQVEITEEEKTEMLFA